MAKVSVVLGGSLGSGPFGAHFGCMPCSISRVPCSEKPNAAIAVRALSRQYHRSMQPRSPTATRLCKTPDHLFFSAVLVARMYYSVVNGISAAARPAF